MREIEDAACSCGGKVVQVEQTDIEQQTHNCPRGCCGIALACSKCGARFVLKFAAPDMD
jgi:hypothetical protein